MAHVHGHDRIRTIGRLFLTAWTRYEAWPILVTALPPRLSRCGDRKPVSNCRSAPLALAGGRPPPSQLFCGPVAHRGEWVRLGRAFTTRDPTYDAGGQDAAASLGGYASLAAVRHRDRGLNCCGRCDRARLLRRDRADRMVHVALSPGRSRPFASLRRFLGELAFALGHCAGMRAPSSAGLASGLLRRKGAPTWRPYVRGGPIFGARRGRDYACGTHRPSEHGSALLVEAQLDSAQQPRAQTASRHASRRPITVRRSSPAWALSPLHAGAFPDGSRSPGSFTRQRRALGAGEAIPVPAPTCRLDARRGTKKAATSRSPDVRHDGFRGG